MSRRHTCIVLSVPQDRKLTRRICIALVSHGVRPILLPWQGIKEDGVPETLKRKIDKSLFVILVVSLDFERSESLHALTKYAFSVKKILIPYKVHPRKLSYGLQIMLASSHWLDVSQMPHPENGIPDLHKAIVGHLENYRERRQWKWVKKLFGNAKRNALFACVAALTLIGALFGLRKANPEVVDPFLESAGSAAEAWSDEDDDTEKNAPADIRAQFDELFDGSAKNSKKIRSAFGESEYESDGNAATETDENADENEDAADGDSDDDEEEEASFNFDEDKNESEENDSGAPLPEKYAADLGDGVKMEFVFVPAGTIRNFAIPDRAVPAFLIGKTEVTQAQYRAVTGENPSNFQGNENCPVEQVSWEDAMRFCTLLTMRKHVAGTLPLDLVFTLPTNEQWTNALNGEYPRTKAELSRVAWFEGNSGGATHPVGKKMPNSRGIYDMVGNVWEFCAGGQIRGMDYSKPEDQYAANKTLASYMPSKTYKRNDLGFRVAVVREASLSDEQRKALKEFAVSEETILREQGEPPGLLEILGTIKFNEFFPSGFVSVQSGLNGDASRKIFPNLRKRFLFVFRFQSKNSALVPDADALNEFFIKNKERIIPVNDLAASSVAVRRALQKRKNLGLAVPMHAPAALPKIAAGIDFALIDGTGNILAQGMFPHETKKFVQLLHTLEYTMTVANRFPEQMREAKTDERRTSRSLSTHASAETDAASKAEIAEFNARWEKIFPQGIMRCGQSIQQSKKNFRTIFRGKYVLAYNGKFELSNTSNVLNVIADELCRKLDANVVPVICAYPINSMKPIKKYCAKKTFPAMLRQHFLPKSRLQGRLHWVPFFPIMSFGTKTEMQFSKELSHSNSRGAATM